MAAKDGPIDPRKWQGFKYLNCWRDCWRGCGRREPGAIGRAIGNSFFDQYATRMILYDFNPTVTALRGLQQFTALEKVQRLCGVKPTSLGSLSEAARVFDPEALEPLVAELAAAPDQVWILATNALGLPAELIAIGDRYRWQIELFFRWLKCVLGCRHLLCENQAGVLLQPAVRSSRPCSSACGRASNRTSGPTKCCATP